MITKPEYACGEGWMEKFSEALKLIPEEYRDKVCSEASIMRNTSEGWRPSAASYHVLNRVIDDLNSGLVPKFPLVEWNREYIQKRF